MKTASETPAAPPGFLNVQTVPPPLMRFSLPAALVVVVFAVIVGGLIGSLVFQMPGTLALLTLSFTGFVSLIVLLSRHDARRTQMEDIVSRYPESDHYAAVRKFSHLWAWSADTPTIPLLPDMLAKRGLLGETIQVWWKADPGSIEPLQEAFEPRVLDEADVGFLELADAADMRGAQASSGPESANIPSTDQLMISRVRRNLRLRGGWFMIVCFSIFTLKGIWNAVQSGRITWFTAYGPAMLLMIMFMPAEKRPLSGTQWLLLPGGLLLRKPTNRGKNVKLHLFDRRRSVLCVYPSSRNTWRLSVADAEMSEDKMITDRERQLLLRAWLCPLTPPPLERLVDLS